ncbi:hepatocellular carcinoma-associated antigen 59-domain-containing protein [Jimgerdemannia flammicorona]|uniref:Hepatocellular carcinoma-associated antigen 59-domain-containing protein n=1 Tax=Jimgerdemannia flammicorona TaxID=994334 RepID=A0A433QH91_9FUNG|nr:hepatocellular carcinoma-associated antigen 59-domain-containing protein [Jimgerdemannia flammicorona]
MSTKKRNYRKKVVSDDDEPSLSKDITETDEEHKDHKDDAEAQEDVSETLEELLELRKLRRRPQGIDAQKLSKGDNKGKKKVKKAVDDPWKLKTGGIVNMDDVRAAERENEEGAEKGLKLDTFTKQTNTLDVDKHMMTYIETELKRRRGQSVEPKEEEEEEEEEAGFKDIYDELYQVPEHLKVEAKPVAEGNVQWSTQMLTAIPEVDLGIDVRLKNIEETEKAKRKMIEDQQKKKKDVSTKAVKSSQTTSTARRQTRTPRPALRARARAAAAGRRTTGATWQRTISYSSGSRRGCGGERGIGGGRGGSMVGEE